MHVLAKIITTETDRNLQDRRPLAPSSYTHPPARPISTRRTSLSDGIFPLESYPVFQTDSICKYLHVRAVCLLTFVRFSPYISGQRGAQQYGEVAATPVTPGNGNNITPAYEHLDTLFIDTLLQVLSGTKAPLTARLGFLSCSAKPALTTQLPPFARSPLLSPNTPRKKYS